MSGNLSMCSVQECGSHRFAKGYCKAHYQRLRRHGDPLGGRVPNGEALRFIHKVALRHTGNECLTWPFGRNNKGYGKIWVDGNHVGVHRYICELVRGAPPTPEHEAAHSCGRGNEACISPIHLDWKTPAQNQADRLIHGTSNSGERNGQAKLTEAAVREILALKGVELQRELAERFGVSRQVVGLIHKGLRWAWISEDPKDIALEFGITPESVERAA